MELASLVQAYESELSKQLRAQLDHTQSVTEKYSALGVSCLGCTTWPLRPVFLDQARLNFIAKTLFTQLEKARQRLLQSLGRPRDLADELGLDVRFVNSLDLLAGVSSPDFLSAVRPDGFYFSDRFVLSEFNLGSGLMATLAYTEVLHEVLAQGPVYKALGWESAETPRPFQAYLRLLRKRLGAKPEPLVGLLSSEAVDVYDWEAELFRFLFQENGIRTQRISEMDLELRDDGWPYHIRQGERFDGIIQLTTGESLLDNPELLAREARILRGAEVGSAPRLHPLACLLLGKGALPWLAPDSGILDRTEDGFVVELPETHFPDQARAAEYRIEKDHFVLKRAWSKKDTSVGCTAHGRAWNRVLSEALAESQFIIQKYYPLPETRIPIVVGSALEWVPVRFELSPFLIEGHYSGALIRYCPSRDGAILSPSPNDLGLTLAF